jgi:6-phosphofructokinase 1
MRIGILTSGGDCPGLNAIIRAATLATLQNHGKIIGFYDGFEGLIRNDYLELNAREVSDIENKGGTILGTTTRGNFSKIGNLEHPNTQAFEDLEKIKSTLAKHQLTALITIGGDGSLRIAQWIGKQANVNIIGIPKTIDNDIQHTEISVGYNTAVATATDAINKIQDTGRSHRRVMLVEVMGRTAGWLAVEAAIASGSDIVIIPEIPFSYDKLISHIEALFNHKRSVTVIVAEGAISQSGTEKIHEASKNLLNTLIERHYDARLTTLGHIQRGGQPTVFDIVLGTKLGAHAINLVQQQIKECALMIQSGQLVEIKIEDLYSPTRLVPPDHELVKTAQSIGIYFGN